MAKDKLPPSKATAAATETKLNWKEFKPCEQRENGGASNMNGGAQCMNGYWVYWADTFDGNGNKTGRERFAKEHKCRLDFKAGRGQMTLSGNVPEDGKSKSA